MYYVDAQVIPVGQWMFYPEAMIARNMHNGNWAHFNRTVNGDWSVSCVNCPATWMLQELAEWFDKWIIGNGIKA